MAALVMNRRTLLLALSSSLALGGCLRPDFRTDQLDATATGSIGARYTLSAGDRLRVIVFGQDNLSNIYAVDGDGSIAMPLIGLVKVGGQSTAQAARTVEAKLASGFVREPHVTVEVDAYRPFYILGEVTTSGQYPYVNGMAVETAVAIAAGFGPRAARDYAVLTREGKGGLVSGIVPMTYPVRPGDTIVIKERFF
ncbi:MAG: polysaccharide biosynthesis/export family protein [Methylobacterium sp.]|jgi:polysaccharide export outer membrane protein|uniref:polysaccharide biosynthesis/export family protein n=1 Tax=unclassified Methylobacterium TaxID=2615210 RepID=UPI0009EAB0DF|nr:MULTISPECIES: polysaccharide biosynthesis/export family protein [unclassified Methylobacterium]MCJ2083342.1 polysaccharide export protein [Methylobacterium sp. J-090]MDO9429469.1 polysaccharide biosynthesis/export family protein [Methylobacterium sp.]TXM78255.1 polysaccharide export protein [Methylobacterium sp. WL69]